MCVRGCVKFVVFGFNFVFLLVGAALITLGVIYKLNLKDIVDAIPPDYKHLDLIPILTIVIGSVIFVISFLGCCGAVRDSSCLLTTYAVILLVLFILQIALGVFAFLEIKDEKDLKIKVERSLDDLFIKAKADQKGETGIVGVLQENLKCCGPKGADFWSPEPIPKTCYPDRDPTKTRYGDGCDQKFYDYLKKAGQIIGITVLSLAATEVIGAIVTLCLANSIRNDNRRGGYSY